MRKRLSFVLCLLLSVGFAVGQYAPSAQIAPQQVSIPSSTASPEPAIDCEGHNDGLYVRDPNHCTDGFYKCANGRSFYYRCPAGLYFGIEDAQCQYKQLIPACGGQRPAQSAPATPVETVHVYQPAPQPVQNVRPQPQAPSYVQPTAPTPAYVQSTTTQAPYQPPQTQTPSYVQQPSQAPYQPPQTQAPIYVQPTTTQAPTTTTRAPVYQPPPAQKPSYPPQAAPVQAAIPSYPISYAQTAAPQYSAPQQPQAPVAASVPQQSYQYGSNPAPAAPQFVASTQPPVDFNCGTNPDGFYSKQPCTQTYYSCSGGIATKLVCQPGTVYDSTINACDYANECGKPRTTTAQPLVNYGYGWQPPTTTTPSTLCVGRTDGFYERGRCVPRYLHCSNGHASDLSCPAGLVFRNDSCTYQSDCLNPTTPAPIAVQAPAGPTPPPLTWCRDNQRSDGYYSQGCSSKYYSCLAGFTSELSCPASLVYDPSQEICEERQFVVVCGGRPRPPTTTTIATPVAPARPVNFDCTGKNNGYYIHGCASNYYACNGGSAIELNCPGQLVFDRTSGACEERQFVVECGGKPKPPTTTVAAPIAPIRPVNFNCGGRSDGYYSVGCGSVYYSCNGGIATELNCPSGTSYSPQIHTCDYKSNVPECGGQLPTTTKSAPIAVGSPSQSGYGYAPPQTQAPYQPPQTQAPYQPPQTQAPVYVQPTTPAPYRPPQTQAPVYVQPPQTQAPVYVQTPQTQASPVYVQQTTTQAPIYVQPTTAQPPAYNPPSPPAYNQQQQVAAQPPSAPVAAAQSESSSSANQCKHLQNGIYGRRCSRHYFVCTDHKIFDFTCPSGFAYDRSIARCGPIEQIPGCVASPMPPAPQPAQNHPAQPPAFQPTQNGHRYKK